MIREVMWSAWDAPGLGHLHMALHKDGDVDDGIFIGVTEGRPFRVACEVRCDVGRRGRAVRVGVPGSGVPRVVLLSDGQGNWTRPDGRAVPELRGRSDVDISVTPFTNTLPIRRLGLAPGDSAELSVAYFEGTELQAWPEPQQYTCLEKYDRGGL